MWLINTKTLTIEYFIACPADKYAILSHTWGDDEPTFSRFRQGKAQTCKGYRKVKQCCTQALEDGLDYAWVDTCCIDKDSSAELSEAINSMFAWYKQARVCYTYLEDFEGTKDQNFADCRWFTRGWTLQELVAPKHVVFFDSTWSRYGDRSGLGESIVEITRIPKAVLLGEVNVTECSLSQRMSWAAGRMTTRQEDIAYCLLGIFDVNMPLLYGEGDRAFYRLQEAIVRENADESIFAWSGLTNKGSGMFAPHPRHFSGDYEPLTNAGTENTPFTITNQGVHFERRLMPLAYNVYLMPLYCLESDKTDHDRYLRRRNQPNLAIFLYRLSTSSYVRIRYNGVDLQTLITGHQDTGEHDYFGDGRSKYLSRAWIERDGRFGHTSTTWGPQNHVVTRLTKRSIFVTSRYTADMDSARLPIRFHFRWHDSLSARRMPPLFQKQQIKCSIDPRLHGLRDKIELRKLIAKDTYRWGFDKTSDYNIPPLKERCIDVSDFTALEDGIHLCFEGARYITQIKVGLDQDFRPVCFLTPATYRDSLDSRNWRLLNMWNEIQESDDNLGPDEIKMKQQQMKVAKVWAARCRSQHGSTFIYECGWGTQMSISVTRKITEESLTVQFWVYETSTNVLKQNWVLYLCSALWLIRNTVLRRLLHLTLTSSGSYFFQLLAGSYSFPQGTFLQRCLGAMVLLPTYSLDILFVGYMLHHYGRPRYEDSGFQHLIAWLYNTFASLYTTKKVSAFFEVVLILLGEAGGSFGLSPIDVLYLPIEILWDIGLESLWRVVTTLLRFLLKMLRKTLSTMIFGLCMIDRLFASSLGLVVPLGGPLMAMVDEKFQNS